MSKYRFSSKLPTDDPNKRIVDPDINKRPIVEKTPNQTLEQYATTTKEIVEPSAMVTEYKYTVQTKVVSSGPVHLRPRFGFAQNRHNSPKIAEPTREPVVATVKKDKPPSPIRDHRHNSTTKDEPAKNYGVNNNKSDKPLGTVHDQGHSSPTKTKSEDNYGVVSKKMDKLPTADSHYKYNSPTKMNIGPKKYGAVDNKSGKASTSPVHENPNMIEEFTEKVQIEASKPTRPGLFSGKNWRNTPKPTNKGGSSTYDEYPNYNNKDLPEKPSFDTNRKERVVEPPIVGKTTWGVPPRQVTPIFGPTNDIGEAVEILKEAVKCAPPPQYTRSRKIDTYNTGAIDSGEAQRRYGDTNPLANPTGKKYSGIIDSREAARKYGGAPV